MVCHKHLEGQGKDITHGLGSCCKEWMHNANQQMMKHEMTDEQFHQQVAERRKVINK